MIKEKIKCLVWFVTKMINSGEKDRNIMITNTNLLSVNKLERMILILPVSFLEG